MPQLNYHHLNYFSVVAKTGNLTRAAQQLHIAQSALSTQIRLLERSLGQSLFVRAARSMHLTEAGRIALAYAETIFAAGNELVSVLREGRAAQHGARRAQPAARGALRQPGRPARAHRGGPPGHLPQVGREEGRRHGVVLALVRPAAPAARHGRRRPLRRADGVLGWRPQTDRRKGACGW